MEYTGKIVHFLNQREDFAIAKWSSENGEKFTILGSLYSVAKDETIAIQGDWQTHAKYGKQFLVERWKRPLPKTKDQVIAFLSSKFIKGCGKKRAELIVKHLGESALEQILKDGSLCLTAFKGIGLNNAEKIAESVKDSFEVQQVMMALLPYGLTTNIVTRLYKMYGKQSIEIVHKNRTSLLKWIWLDSSKPTRSQQQSGLTLHHRFGLIQPYIMYSMSCAMVAVIVILLLRS